MPIAMRKRIQAVPQSQEQSSCGRVYLVGAGPGDPELITLKGLRCLRMADVVVYDRLISPYLLDEAPSQAERVFSGKEPGCHSMKQEVINALLIKYARQGRLVVRLKGGDPFVFGRAGIPVTHRNHASSVTIVTGHEQRTHISSAVNWEALAKVGGTLVIMIGMEALAQITQQLLAGGLSPDTAAAAIQQGTVPQQRVITGTLVNIAERARIANVKSPAIIVIGTVVTLSRALAWFETACSGVNQVMD